MRKKRADYSDTPWGLIGWLFQKSFLKVWVVIVTVIFAFFMWSNFSCDMASGPRIEKTTVKAEIKK